MSLSRDQILAQRPWPCEEVQIPEWGGSVWVRALSAAELDEFQGSIVQARGRNVEVNRRNYRANLASRVVVAEDKTTRLFTDHAEIAALGAQQASALERICAVAHRLSGMGDEDQEALVKN